MKTKFMKILLENKNSFNSNKIKLLKLISHGHFKINI